MVVPSDRFLDSGDAAQARLDRRLWILACLAAALLIALFAGFTATMGAWSTVACEDHPLTGVVTVWLFSFAFVWLPFLVFVVIGGIGPSRAWWPHRWRVYSITAVVTAVVVTVPSLMAVC